MDAQIKHGLLDVCVLAAIKDADSYGYQIIKDIKPFVEISGDVELDACDAASLSIRTNTGDVKGSLLTPKVFDADSPSGKIRLPDERSGGRCEVRTNTGDIEFRIFP